MSGGEQFQGNTLAITDVAAERELAARCITRMARDAEDEALLMDVALNVRRRPALSRFSRRNNPAAPASRRSPYRYPVPEGPEGYPYRAKVRAWGVSQGYEVRSRGCLEAWLLNAYVDTTGDYYEVPEGER